jgi:hypothetical protein
MKQQCSTCKWWDYDRATKTPTGRLARYTRSDCLWPAPTTVLPDSITKQYGFRPYKRTSRDKADGAECPCWEPKP